MKVLTINFTPELCPRILFCNGLGLLEEMLHEECSLIEASLSPHPSSATLPERKYDIKHLGLRYPHENNLFSHIKCLQGYHDGIGKDNV